MNHKPSTLVALQISFVQSSDQEGTAPAQSSAPAPASPLDDNDVVGVRSCNDTQFPIDDSERTDAACSYLLESARIDRPYACYVRSPDDDPGDTQSSCFRVRDEFSFNNGAPCNACCTRAPFACFSRLSPVKTVGGMCSHRHTGCLTLDTHVHRAQAELLTH